MKCLLEPIKLAHYGKLACEDAMATKVVQNLLKSKDSYDLIITEYFNSNCFLGFAHKFGAPVVTLSSSTLMPWNNEPFGNPDNPSYIPENLLYFSDKMSFFQRVENTIVGSLHRWMYYLLMDRPGNQFAKQYFGRKLPDLRDMAFNTSLMLVNTHFSLNLPRPLVPSVVEVGGIHIGKINTLPRVSL